MTPKFKELIKEGKELGTAAAAGEDRAQGSMGNMARVAIGLVVALSIAALVGAFLLPIGIQEIVDVDTSNWSSGAQSMWNLLDVIIVLAVALFFFGVALAATEMI